MSSLRQLLRNYVEILYKSKGCTSVDAAQCAAVILQAVPRSCRTEGCSSLAQYLRRATVGEKTMETQLRGNKDRKALSDFVLSC